jgi:hypothetical protein
MRRAEMQMERAEAERAAQLAQQKQQQQATLAAKQREHAEAAYGDVFKARDTQDFAGMSAAAERLRQHGGLAEDMGADEQGRPSYRLGVSAEEYQQQQGQRDAQAAEQPGEESLPQSLNRLNALGYDTTTEGVVDTGALQDQTQRQLRPQLDAYRQSFPEAYRDSVGHSNDAAAALAGSPADGLKLAREMGTAPQAAIGREEDNERDAKRLDLDERKFAWEQGKEGKEKPLSRKDIQDMRVYGEKKAEEPYNNLKLAARVTALDGAQTVLDVLGDADPDNDMMAVNALMKLNENVGPQSDADAERVTGEQKASFMKRVEMFYNSLLKGGIDPKTRASLKAFAENLRDRHQNGVYGYISDMSTAADGERDELVANGIRGYVERNIPGSLLRRYEAEHQPKAEDEKPADSAAPQGATATPIRFNMEEDAAEHGDPMGAVQIPETSRIAFEHNNPGNLKFVGQAGAEQGEEAGGGGHWARFKSVDEGLQALRGQVMHDAEQGLSIRDFIMKYAPPTDGNDTERYIEEAVRALKAESSDDALAETDPYDVVRFVAQKESSTVLPDQYAKEPAAAAQDKKPAAEPAKKSEPKPKGKAGKHDDWKLLE